jgi:methylmalonyl-CoA mutase cobalamin-binding subunit
MANTNSKLSAKLIELLASWREQGCPGRATMHAAADELLAWRRAEKVPGLWKRPPLMLGATLDDGWGHGIRLILKFAEALGCGTNFLGVLRPIDTIVEACEKESPDILGLTVLQLDTEDDLRALIKRLPRKIRIIAGGPVFSIDPEFAGRTGVDFVARDAAQFIRYLLADAEEKRL